MKYLSFILCSFLLVELALAVPNEFPGRKLYLAVPYIELQDLYNKRKNVVFVDVRSGYEFQTLRIKGAINIPLASPDFTTRMKQLRGKHASKPIVVYCNGKTCMKSYKAVSKCRLHGISNVIAYDAGIMDWAKRYPAEAVLLGKTPINPANLIKKSRFKNHLLAPERFEERVATSNALVLDVRDPFQREGISIFVGKEQRAPLDNKQLIDKYLEKARKENRTLLVYDAAGKQVRWLMYHIEEKGVKSYYFMNGGAHAYYKNLRQQFVR
ncbi:MAG: rhodanese-like domain-containing protein [Gammaproteobacteria bacterium]|nr:rhodanese-like domain-containing protein [Gammaproteobacteria bacterium]